MIASMADLSVQERYGPQSVCFGCGPANPDGLHIKSRPTPGRDDELVAEWMPQKRYEAFEGYLNGGIIGTLLDCHCNWTAAYHLMRRAGASHPPFTVTAEYTIKMRRPTPTDRPLRLRARVVEASGDRAVVEGTLEADGVVTATCRGLFVAVGPGHPAYNRWRPAEP
jgi:acyl-coenzyme A thioesterase PaaI-like protein